MASVVLIAIAGVTLPLGLHDGPPIPGAPQSFSAKYIPDTSPLALSTAPNREKFQYGRFCGPKEVIPCPEQTDEPNNTTFPLSIVHAFNSTAHSPFIMQYRRFYQSVGNSRSGSSGQMGITQSLVQRDGLFAVEGLIVDMSATHPGIGFWNHTVPMIAEGGTWSQDVLWLEPLTTCVNTNVTFDYMETSGPKDQPQTYNITDHGGFYGLPHSLPSLNLAGQNIDLVQHAYLGAVLSNTFAMKALNATVNSTFEGKAYPAPPMGGLVRNLGKFMSIPLSYLNGTADDIATTTCRGYGYDDSESANSVQVSCGGFLGPPVRMDGGDQREFNQSSWWSQSFHACASTTRASIQTITFSINDTSKLQNLQMSRQPSNGPVLWAMEKTNLSIGSIDLMWGRVDDKFENDSSLWTMRSEGLYLPAGSMGEFGAILYPGIPQATHTATWAMIYDPSSTGQGFDNHYSGESDYAMKAKFQSLVGQDPSSGNAQIRNLIWTDFMANNVLGTATNSTIMVAQNHPSLAYDLRFAIPGFILFLIWAPAFFIALALLAARKLKFAYVSQVLNHTSLGRVVVGASLLRAEPAPGGDGYFHGHRNEKDNLVDTSAARLVLHLDRRGGYERLPRETLLQ